jgi:uncharacterized protein YndB with AHSA1/START domain
MILKVLSIVALLIALVMLYAACQPSTLRLQRSVVIDAHPDKVFALINDLHRWPDWNQDGDDSTVTRTFSGPDSGVGAESQWDSRGKAGKGSMLITESQPFSRIVVKADFVRPFGSHNLNEFALEPAGASTRVTWSWQGQNLYFMKLMGVFVNMDRMIGQHFEDSLAKLKSLAEK